MSDTPIPHYLNHEKLIPITAELFKNDALIFKNIASHKVALHHHKTGHRITMHTGHAPHFGLWAKPNAAFVCFEPWYSFDDAASADGKLQNKPGMMQLAQNGTFKTGYQLLPAN